MKSLLLFGAACLFVFMVASAVSVYGFDQYEHAWGRGSSFQVEAWLALVGSIIAMGSFGISSAVLHHAPKQAASLVLGLACAISYLALCWGINSYAPSSGIYVALVLLIAVPVLASFVNRRLASYRKLLSHPRV